MLSRQDDTGGHGVGVGVVVTLALLLYLVLPSVLRGLEEEPPYLEFDRVELRGEAPSDVYRHGRFLFDVAVTCSEHDDTIFTYEVEELSPRSLTVASGNLQLDELGRITSQIDWRVLEEHCASTWDGRVTITSLTEREDREPLEMTATRVLAISLPRDVCPER
jgi:hypothetical protein